MLLVGPDTDSLSRAPRLLRRDLSLSLSSALINYSVGAAAACAIHRCCCGCVSSSIVPLLIHLSLSPQTLNSSSDHGQEAAAGAPTVLLIPLPRLVGVCRQVYRRRQPGVEPQRQLHPLGRQAQALPCRRLARSVRPSHNRFIFLFVVFLLGLKRN